MGEGRMRVQDVRQEVGEPFHWMTEEEGEEETWVCAIQVGSLLVWKAAVLALVLVH